MERAIQVDSEGNPCLTQLSEEGFINCVFRIIERSDTDTHYRFRLLASHDGKVVGMNATVLKGMGAGYDSEMKPIHEHAYTAGVTLHRSGPESDHLLSVISSLYGRGDGPRRMADHESLAVIALHQHPLDMECGQTRLKLFGRNDEPFIEEDYYECFLKLDLPRGLVEWNEKDWDYREPLLRAMSR